MIGHAYRFRGAFRALICHVANHCVRRIMSRADKTPRKSGETGGWPRCNRRRSRHVLASSAPIKAWRDKRHERTEPGAGLAGLSVRLAARP